MTKFVTMAEAVSQLEQNPKMQELIKTLKERKEKSPARHNRQYNIELMNISMMLNHHCQQISYCTSVVLDDEYSQEDRNEAYKCRAESLIEAAKLQQQYNDLVAELDQAIIDEDNNKIAL